MKIPLLAILLFVLVALSAGALYMRHSSQSAAPAMPPPQEPVASSVEPQKAYFAAGCFWCAEKSFEQYPGVIDAVSGYAGGVEATPTYEQVSGGKTAHREAVEVTYDPQRITYGDLLQIFWRTANPTDDGGQYVDRGAQYTSAIFPQTEEEIRLASGSRAELKSSGRFGTSALVTPIVPFTTFYPAEEYHQDYYKKNPLRYSVYTNGSGRKEFLEKVWGTGVVYALPAASSAPVMDDLRTRLTPLQYRVTQEDATEPPFKNEYNDEKRAGIYVDIVDGTPLFSSLDKYDSGTGWPSFVKPIDPSAVTEHEDNTLFSVRTEIRSTKADSHLGHVFDDGPTDRGGKRYCMNSAALRFIPVEDLEKEGYGEWAEMFSK